jgi:sodium-dependent phosphate cotransporter
MTDIEKNVDVAPTKEQPEEKAAPDVVLDDASWQDVFESCCCHSITEWALILVGVSLVCLCLYFFLFGIGLLGTGAKVMSGCSAGELFGDETNPVAGLMIGIVSTALIQSSSTTTSIVVALVGAESVSVNQGIYMVMGANIGTSVTNTIIAMGQMGDGDQLERAFAGATVHDMFNFLSVAVFFPLELITGYLVRITSACVKNFESKDGDKWVGPIKKIVSPLSNKVIIANKNVIKGVAKGASCGDFYPIQCEDPEFPTQSTCSQVGLIACDKKTDACPAFFQATASRSDDQMSGIAVFIIGIVVLFVCLFGMVAVLQRMLLTVSTRIIHKATGINGYIAILVGWGVTMVVQSSSITTSTFTPLVGLDIVQLEQMFPITLGANLGTTVTAIMAAMLSNSQAMQVALAHMMFNLSGIIVWYPIPFMRNIPLNLARKLGKSTRIWKGIPVVYILVVFLILPLLLLGLSVLFTKGVKGFTAVGILVTTCLLVLLVYTTYWFYMANGKERVVARMEDMQKRKETFQTLPEEMELLKSKVKQLEEHAGLLADEAPSESNTLTENVAKEDQSVEENA